MLKNIIKIIGMGLLMMFSFYYTEKSVNLIKSYDPIMKMIEKERKTYHLDSVDMVMTDDGVIPGYNGRQVNVNHSYQEMLRYGDYDPNMMVFDETSPRKSSCEVYDRYILKGNSVKNGVALLFSVEVNDDIESILELLEKEKIKATFFVDGKWIEENKNTVVDLVGSKHELENLGYEGKYGDLSIDFTNKYIETFTSKKGKYCLFEKENMDDLKLCEKTKMMSVKPDVISNEYLYKTVVRKVQSGSIISMKVNDTTKKELSSTIRFLKTKGYQFYKLDSLLSEGRELENFCIK